jgi:hypothetical protein
MRILRILDEAFLMEYRRIVADNILLYGKNFASTNSDFYTNSERRESFGCLVANMLAQRYVLKDGRRVFMSNKTFKDSEKTLVAISETQRSDLEAVLSFEQFPKVKTAQNIAQWLQRAHLKAGLKPQHILCHSTDGASNAVGSAMEFQAITAATRESNIAHYICFAHQVNRSARYASGTGGFANNANPELSELLQKLHEINGRVYRNETRLKVLFQVQKEKNRKVIRRPFHGVATRWNSDIEEVKHTNIFMGDYQRALSIMLGDKGCDSNLVKDRDGKPVADKATLMFTNTDQMILRQYECAAEPVLALSKFFQLDVPTAHLVLVHLRFQVAQLRENKFLMYSDISHSALSVLTNRTKTETVVTNEVTEREESGRTEAMHECVSEFRTIFADDIELRCQLRQVVEIQEDEGIMQVEDVARLPEDIAIACLLHPIGGKPIGYLVSFFLCND